MGSIYRRTPKGNYHAEYTGPNGRRVRRSTGTTNKQDAARILAKWESEANAIAKGISVDPQTDIFELVHEWADSLQGSLDYQVNFRSKVTRLLERAEVATVDDLDAHAIELALRQIASQRNTAKRTQAYYASAARSFGQWLVKRRAVLANPLAELQGPKKIQSDRRIVRRFLLHEEWEWLRKTPNAIIYETAIQTGFRAKEIAALRPGYLQDDHILLPGRYTKNRQDAKQYIPPALAERLRGALPFDMPRRAVDMFYPDLAEARRMWLDSKPETQPDGFLSQLNAQNQRLDFHALRHTCGAWLALAGVQPKIIQSVMRHSSITLTLDTYGHLMPGAEQDAAGVLAGLLACQ